MVVYNFFRKTNNWTPRQVDELSLTELEWLPLMEAAYNEAQETIREMEQFRNSGNRW